MMVLVVNASALLALGSSDSISAALVAGFLGWGCWLLPQALAAQRSTTSRLSVAGQALAASPHEA